MSESPSQPPPSEPESNQPRTTIKTDQTTETSNRIQTVLKVQTIKALQGTIELLEKWVVKLESEPPATTELTFLDKLQLRWSATLAKIRSLLPENLSSKLSDSGLTAIIAVIAVLLVWTTSAILPGKPPIEVANVPPSAETPPAEPPNKEPVPTPTIATPPELTAPAEPQPIEVTPTPEPAPTPTPTVELTPEQTLIATIENQVAEISDRFADGLIQSIQVNFEGSSLTIKVGDDWYTLQQSQQDKLALRMLDRARELDFSRLEITDPQGTLLARSPIVGNDMVILKR